MMHSAPNARKVMPVSFSDSPFSMEEDWELISAVSAPSPFAASSKEVRGAGAGLVEEEGDAAMGQPLCARCWLLGFQFRRQAKDVRDIVQLQRGHGEQRP